MSKKRKSFTLDGDNARLCEKMDNASALVNDLLTQYRQGMDRQVAALELQIKHKKERKAEAESKAKQLGNEIAELRELKDHQSKQDTQVLREAKEKLKDVPKEPDNDGVKNWAGKANMTPEQLIEEMASLDNTKQ